jgi:hypothetical protein
MCGSEVCAWVLCAARVPLEGDGNSNNSEGRNISVISEFIYHVVHAMEIVRTRAQSNIQFTQKMVGALYSTKDSLYFVQ